MFLSEDEMEEDIPWEDGHDAFYPEQEEDEES